MKPSVVIWSRLACLLALLGLLPLAAQTPKPVPPAPAPAGAVGDGNAVALAWYKTEPGSAKIKTQLLDWRDAERGRPVPVKLYYPETAAGPLPVILFSHGLGGSRESYPYLGRHWASHGYLVCHIQHLGSDEAVWKNQPKPAQALREAVGSIEAALGRPMDVRYVLDQLTKLNGELGPLKGRLDMSRVGIAGHSFGAWTALVAAGQVAVLPNGKEVQLNDPRVKACVAMSAPVGDRPATYPQNYARIRIPCLHLTGTEDVSVIRETSAAERRIPYDHSLFSDQYLMTFAGGTHALFSGVANRDKKAAEYIAMIRSLTTAFFDARLRQDPAAIAWMDTPTGVAALLRTAGVWECRPAAPAPATTPAPAPAPATPAQAPAPAPAQPPPPAPAAPASAPTPSAPLPLPGAP